MRATVLTSSRLGPVARESFETRYSGNRAEVDAEGVLSALRRACSALDVRDVDVVALAAMAPSWVAMNSAGRALTPIVTHQDRRSVEQGQRLLGAFGEADLLARVGNLPFPGSISSTTCAWFVEHEARRMRQAALVGHLGTLLLRRLCGARLIDPGSASFLGLRRIDEPEPWDAELLRFIGLPESALPEVRDGDSLAGTLSPAGARLLGARAGTPVLVGCMDTSAAALLGPLRAGAVLNVSGSTDVLAAVCSSPRPHRKLLTRRLGVGPWWLAVGTLASAGSTLSWAQQVFYPELDRAAFAHQLRAAAGIDPPDGLVFDPYLAGDRMSMEPLTGGFRGVSLGVGRLELLAAIVRALARISAERWPALRQACPRLGRDVLVSGGVDALLSGVMRRDWPKGFRYRSVNEATLLGLRVLAERWARG